MQMEKEVCGSIGLERFHLLSDPKIFPFRAVPSVFICGHLWSNSSLTAEFRFNFLPLQLPLLDSISDRTHCPTGGCQSSTLFPSGSITQANFPNSESSILSSTLQPSSFSTFTSDARSSTR